MNNSILEVQRGIPTYDLLLSSGGRIIGSRAKKREGEERLKRKRICRSLRIWPSNVSRLPKRSDKLRENLDCFRSHSIRSFETFRSLQEFNSKKKKKNNYFLYSYNNFQKIIIFEIICK